VEALEDRTVPSLFNAPTTFDLPARPVDEAVGHFRGPTAPLDVVTLNVDGTLSVLLGNGDGSLRGAVNYAVGASPNALAVGDFLGNGRQDVVTANADGTVSVFLSNADGSLQTPRSIALGHRLGGVAVGDFLGHGRLDLVVAGGSTVSVLAGNGDGTFGGPIDTSVSGGGGLGAVAVGDFNGDGTPDLAVGASAGLDVLQGNGDGTFRLTGTVSFGVDYLGDPIPVDSVRVANFSGGTLDLVAEANGRVSVLRGNGDGSFRAPAALNAFVTPHSFAVGDFTGDGKPDLVTISPAVQFSTPTLTVFAGNGDGTFQPGHTVNVGESAVALAAGDFRGDGKLDLAVASLFGFNHVDVLTGNGDGTFALTSYAAGRAPWAVATGDFTGSGKDDIVVANAIGNPAVLLNNGDGTFRSGLPLPVPGQTNSVVVGDFNGDGKLDVVVTTTANAHALVRVFLGNGNGTFQAGQTIDLGFNHFAGAMVVGDFAHNGRADIAVLDREYPDTGRVTVLLGNGNGTFQDPVSYLVGEDISGLAVADFNGDGKLDLVTTVRDQDSAAAQQQGLRKVEVLFGNGDGTFQAPVKVGDAHASTSLAVGDLRGNGKQDLILADYFLSDNLVDVMLGNGDGTFQDPVTYHVGKSPDAVVLGDFFGDGHLSIAVSNLEASTVGVLRGNGDGTFQDPVNFLVGDHVSEPTSLAVGDFLGHGKIDLVTTNFLSNDVTVLLNQGAGTTQAPPTVESLVVNDGSVQRSQVTSLTVTFSSQVSLGDGALTVQRQDGSLVPVRVNTSVVNGKTVAVVTFTGDDVVAGSLPDGNYQLTVHHELVHDSAGQALAQDAGLAFFRLAGDVDGDGDLDDQDLQAVAPTLSSVRLNEGDTSGAQVSSITVHFSGVVTLTPGAFELVQQGGGTIGLVLTTSVVDGNTVAVLTFTGDVPVNGALPDGAYTLTVHGELIHDGQGLALGGAFTGDNAADFFGADGAGQPDLVGLFHPVGV
jgi:hypothetical protein